jgi:FHA domain
LEATLTSSLGRTTLSSGIVSIGQASDNQLIIDDPQASAHHADIQPSPDGAAYLLTDQSSTNGTFVNEERLSVYTPRALNTGDVIRIGNLHLTYETVGIVNPYETTVAAPLIYVSTATVIPNASSDHPTDVAQAQSSQPDYPPSIPDQFGVPPRRKRRLGLWITLAVVAILLIGGGSALGIFYYTNRSTPAKTLQAFCTDFKNADAQGLYNQLSSHAQAETSVDKLSSVFQFIQLAGGIHDCTVTKIQEHGSTATGNLVITSNDDRTSQPFSEHLINEGGTWKVDDSPSQSS